MGKEEISQTRNRTQRLSISKLYVTRQNSFRCLRPGLIKTGLCSHRRWLEASHNGFKKVRNCAISVVKTKVLISCAVTAQLICVFVFAYAKSRFSDDAAPMSHGLKKNAEK